METDLVLPNDEQRERLYRLAATIETKEGVDPANVRHEPAIRDGDGFSMQQYDFTCGTPACIAGWACWQFAGDRKAAWGMHTLNLLNEYLGLGADDAAYLFTPTAHWDGEEHVEYDMQSLPGELGNITPRHAAACLRHYADTGVVDWEAAKKREHKDAAG